MLSYNPNQQSPQLFAAVCRSCCSRFRVKSRKTTSTSDWHKTEIPLLVPRFPTSGVTGRSLCPEPGKSRRSHLWSARTAPHCHGRGKFSFEVNKIAKSTSIRPRNPTKLLHNVHRPLARNVFKNQASKSTIFACGRRFVLEVLAALLLLRQVKCQCIFIQQLPFPYTGSGMHTFKVICTN